MLYKKNVSETLSDELFKNPTSEYRGTPFWAWNSDLEKDELLRQIEIFKEMGLGGFHMHVRTGMSTEYLSVEFMNLVKACADKANDENMLAWLYDEDRWPSGAAGGLVTKDKQYRARYLLFTAEPDDCLPSLAKAEASAAGDRNGEGYLVACYDVSLDENGFLKGYRRITEDDTTAENKWYAYLKIHSPSSWYNNQTYVNTLDKKSIERFVEVTHEKYRETVGNYFGNVVPAIFTDEPQFTRKKLLNNSLEKQDVIIPWTDDFPETYEKMYDDDILEKLPELFWECEGKVSQTRYRYHDHIAERFAEAFADTCGSWCRKNGIALTGHMMEEPTLQSQTAALGEAMRSYRGFDLPGIDMLCNRYEFTTAKQAQSAAHQYGCEGVLSELYGVTGWDCDFRTYKLQGDWQAALGITVRVPHLSWVSMGGAAKRDYPASISYQSPWYKEYPLIENHFGRVNTALTRGKPVIKVGVIHPVESFWLYWGPNDKTALIRNNLDTKFQNLTDWLLKGSIDFNFISESLLPTLCKDGSAPFKVGKMEYDTIIVPGCITLRSTTLERLEQFKKSGGNLIFLGSAPKYENALDSTRGKELFDVSRQVEFDEAQILDALDKDRTVTLRQSDGQLTNNLIYQLRKDNDCSWLFISHACNPYNKDVCSSTDTVITVKGIYEPVEYDTISGDIKEIPADYRNGNTVIRKKFYDYDSLLLKLVPGKESSVKINKCCQSNSIIKVPDIVDYELSEQNCLLLDMAQYSLDGGEFKENEEILRLDNICRKELGMENRGGGCVQPWVIEKEVPTHSITLRFTFTSEIEYNGASLCVEDAEKVKIVFNGESVDNNITGWYVDKAIKTIPLPRIIKGINMLDVTVPFGKRTDTEWCYIIGNFGVKVRGIEKTITSLPEKMAFSDYTYQGLPFYGGNIEYNFTIDTTKSSIAVSTTEYRGGCVKVSVDGEEKYTTFSPYCAEFNGIGAGKHNVKVTLFGNRKNSFGAVHNSDNAISWHGPGAWESDDEKWSYEYQLIKAGLLTAPVIKEFD